MLKTHAVLADPDIRWWLCLHPLPVASNNAMVSVVGTGAVNNGVSHPGDGVAKT